MENSNLGISRCKFGTLGPFGFIQEICIFGVSFFLIIYRKELPYGSLSSSYKIPNVKGKFYHFYEHEMKTTWLCCFLLFKSHSLFFSNIDICYLSLHYWSYHLIPPNIIFFSRISKHAMHSYSGFRSPAIHIFAKTNVRFFFWRMDAFQTFLRIFPQQAFIFPDVKACYTCLYGFSNPRAK